MVGRDIVINPLFTGLYLSLVPVMETMSTATCLLVMKEWKQFYWISELVALQNTNLTIFTRKEQKSLSKYEANLFIWTCTKKLGSTEV